VSRYTSGEACVCQHPYDTHAPDPPSQSSQHPHPRPWEASVGPELQPQALSPYTLSHCVARAAERQEKADRGLGWSSGHRLSMLTVQGLSPASHTHVHRTHAKHMGPQGAPLGTLRAQSQSWGSGVRDFPPVRCLDDPPPLPPASPTFLSLTQAQQKVAQDRGLGKATFTFTSCVNLAFL
jgi:hypothetical protein